MEHYSLKELCEKAFNGDVGATALALGREQDQIETLINSGGEPDEDLELKIQGIAMERIEGNNSEAASN